MARDPRKVSLYLPNDVLKQIEAEAHRQDRSMSWIVRLAWQLAKNQLNTLPALQPGNPAASDTDDE